MFGDGDDEDESDIVITSHFLKLDRYRDTHAYILDPCIQEF